MKKAKPKERGQPQRLSIPFRFDDAIARALKVKPPADGDYKKALEKRERKAKKKS